MKHNPNVPIYLLFLGAIALVVITPVWAGNSEMVTKSVEELEAINREAVAQVEDLPRHGKVGLKAKVSTRAGKRVVKVLDQKVQAKAAAPRPLEPATEVVEGNLEFNKIEKIPQGEKSKPSPPEN